MRREKKSSQVSIHFSSLSFPPPFRLYSDCRCFFVSRKLSNCRCASLSFNCLAKSNRSNGSPSSLSQLDRRNKFYIFCELISLDFYCDFLFLERHVSYSRFPSDSCWHAVESLRNCIHSDVANEDKVSGQSSKAQEAFRDRNNFLFRRCGKLSFRLDW